MMEAIRAYPLQWPTGWARTAQPVRSKFKCTFTQARDGVLYELDRIGAPDWCVIISSNLPTRRDGLPYANRSEPDDPAVAVYWLDNNEQRQVMACDRWDRVRDNLRSIERSLEALRGLRRWGSTEIAERAFTGFASLPPSGEDWRSVLGFDAGWAVHPENLIGAFETVRSRYRERAIKAHPDVGGNAAEMVRLNQALEAAKQELLGG